MVFYLTFSFHLLFYFYHGFIYSLYSAFSFMFFAAITVVISPQEAEKAGKFSWYSAFFSFALSFFLFIPLSFCVEKRLRKGKRPNFLPTFTSRCKICKNYHFLVLTFTFVHNILSFFPERRYVVFFLPKQLEKERFYEKI